VVTSTSTRGTTGRHKEPKARNTRALRARPQLTCVPLWIVQLRHEGGRDRGPQVLGHVAEEEPHKAARLDHGEAGHQGALGPAAGLSAGHVLQAALCVKRVAVVGAHHARVAGPGLHLDLAARQRGTAVRAPVVQAPHLPGLLVAEEHQAAAQDVDTQGLVIGEVAAQGSGVPKVAQVGLWSCMGGLGGGGVRRTNEDASCTE